MSMHYLLLLLFINVADFHSLSLSYAFTFYVHTCI